MFEKDVALMDTLVEAVDKYLPLRRIRVCSTDKPWVSSK